MRRLSGYTIPMNKSALLAVLLGALSSGILSPSQPFAPGERESPLRNDLFDPAPAANLSDDCAAKSPPRNFSRIFIALRPGSKAGSGTASDPYDGSTAERFDALLRSRSEANQQNLIVCIGPGTFQTEGTYDFVILVAHKTSRGFTLNKNWKIHGAGIGKTVLKLVSFLPNPPNRKHGTGDGVVFSTHDDSASGIEISDLSIDDNYPALKPLATQMGISALNLEAIHLRADQGGHWIHRISVARSSGEISEAFPVWIVSVSNKSPALNSGNIIEEVSVNEWGGGTCTAITIANALGEIRNNVVRDYQIGYGGWSLGEVAFHDNVAADTEYGFNIDSLENNGVRIYNNRIIHPRHYGMVIGGGGRYANFQITGNTIAINTRSAIGILFQGNVTGALIERNTFVADPPATRNLRTVVTKNRGNQGNIERSNQVVLGGGAALDRPPGQD
jgi:hypothetical protein